MKLFVITIISIFLLSLYILTQINFSSLLPPIMTLHSFSEFLENLSGIFGAIPNGYRRSILGYLIFLLMSLTFVKIGRILMNHIFNKDNLKTDIPSTEERIGYEYLLGSLIISLFWFVMGRLGFLSTPVAWALLIPGVFYGYSILKKRNIFPTLKTADKILIGVLFFLLLLMSSNAVILPQQNDTLFSHAALPNFYIQNGFISESQFNYYSYYPQNTELLVLWAFLLKSDFAASLLIWGFMTVCVFLIIGFLRRKTNLRVALLTALVFISFPIVTYASTYIKNDLTVTAFILAHYFALMVALDQKRENLQAAKKWVLLSGILCGGAIGHKLTALPAAGCSFLILVAFDVWNRRKAREYLSLTWLAGCAVLSAPWLIRSLLITGNPFYPTLTMIFGSAAQDPWMLSVEKGLQQASLNWNVFMIFLRDATLGNQLHEHHFGPMVLFTLLFLPLVISPISIGLRGVLVASFASFVLLLFKTQETRFHIPYLSFLICTCFAFSYEYFLKQIPWKKFRHAAFVVILFSIGTSSVFFLFLQHLSVLIAGFPPGNVRGIERNIDNLYWIAHLVNTRSSPDDVLLLAGMKYSYGFKRKMLWGSEVNIEPFYALASKAQSPSALAQTLKNKRIRHLIAGPSFPVKLGPNAIPPADPSVLARIKSMIDQEMFTYYQTPDQTIQWYRFHEDKDSSISFEAKDALEFPPQYIDEALALFNRGQIEDAKALVMKAFPISMYEFHKITLYQLLADIHESNQGKASTDALNIYRKMRALFPDYSRSYSELGKHHLNRGEFNKAEGYFLEQIKVDPKDFRVHNNIGVLYYRTNRAKKAVEHFKRSIVLNPQYKTGYENLANVYKIQGKQDHSQSR